MTEDHPEYTCPTSGLTGYQLYAFVRLLHLPDETQRDRELRTEALKELEAYGSNEQRISRHVFHHIGQCTECCDEFELNSRLYQGFQFIREQKKTLHERILEEARKHVRVVH